MRARCQAFCFQTVLHILNKMISQNVAKAFGRVIRTLRRERDISQVELARLGRIDRTYVWRLERGDHEPTLGAILRLARSMGVDPADLVKLVQLRLSAGLRNRRGRTAGARRQE